VGVKTVSVIGATGYLGSHISAGLAAAGHRVRAWGRRRPEGAAEWAGLFERLSTGDLEQNETVDAIVDEASDALVYCVSLDHRAAEQDPDRAWQVNVRPVWQLLDRLSQRGPSRFVFLSTSQVYGTVEGRISEITPTQPRNHYALTHLMAEQVVQRYCDKQGSGISLRLSNGFGAPVFEDANCWWLVINDFCRTAVNDGEIRLMSAGLQQRDFIHVDDITAAVSLVVGLPGKRLDKPFYNVGSGRAVLILELAHRVADVCERLGGDRIPVLMPDGSRSVGFDMHVPTNTLSYSPEAFCKLGFEPAVSLDQGIRRLLKDLMRRKKA